MKTDRENIREELMKISKDAVDFSEWSDKKVFDTLKYTISKSQYQRQCRVLETEWQTRLSKKQATATYISAAAAVAMLIATGFLIAANVSLAASSQRLADITERANEPLVLSLQGGRQYVPYTLGVDSWERIFVTNRTDIDLRLDTGDIWISCKGLDKIIRVAHPPSIDLPEGEQHFEVLIKKEIFQDIEKNDECTFNIFVVTTNGTRAGPLSVPLVQQ